MHRLVTLVLAATSCLSAIPVETNLHGLRHASWTERDGAPHGIHALAQTSDGYLWIGTSAGLFRFDGLRFSVFVPRPDGPQFNSLDISALAADSENGLWIGFHLGGISWLKQGRLTNYDAASGLPLAFVEQILPRPGGSVWAVTAGRLMKLTGSRWEEAGTPLGLSADGIHSLFFDHSGNLWVGGNHILSVLHPGHAQVEMVPENVKAVTQFVEAAGAIWISDGWTSVRPMGASDAPGAHVIRGAASLLYDSDGYLWIANDYFGIDVTNPGNPKDAAEHFGEPDGLTSKDCGAIIQDAEGNIWVGTGLGLDRFHRQKFTPYMERSLRSFPGLAAGMEGSLWISSWGNPLLEVKDGKTAAYGDKRGWGPIYRDRNNVVWQYDYWRKEFSAFQNGEFRRVDLPPGLETTVVQSITGDNAGGLYVSMEHDGIWRLQGERWEKLEIPGVSLKSPISLLSDSAGRLWSGFGDGHIVVIEHGAPKVFDAGGNSTLGSVMTLYEKDQRIWAGGTNGLVVFTGGRFERLLTVEGVVLQGVSGVVASSENDLWLNAASGVIRLSSSEVAHAIQEPAYRMQAEIFDFRDGVSGVPAQLRPTPTAIADSAGKLWFATSGNILSVDPGAFNRERAPVKIVIESVNSDGAARPVGGAGPTLVHARNLEIDYVGISLTSPQHVAYRYRLDGEDIEWHDAGTRRQAIYTSLHPGRYRFHIQATIGDGHWSEIEMPGEVVVPPAFYQTAWFVIACLFAAIAGLSVVYTLRVHHITARVRERLEERSAERVRLARDLHDTLLQGLQGLMLRFHFAAEKIPQDTPARAMMEQALEVADRVVEEGRDRVKNLRCELSGRDLAKALAETGAELNWENSVRFTVLTQGTGAALGPAVEGELYFIGREAIANAFRHSGASQIDVEIISSGAELRLLCRDNGCGMRSDLPAQGASGHWGMMGMRERSEKIGANFECWSAPGKGTQIAVSLSPPRMAFSVESILRLFRKRPLTRVQPRTGA